MTARTVDNSDSTAAYPASGSTLIAVGSSSIRGTVAEMGGGS